MRILSVPSSLFCNLITIASFPITGRHNSTPDKLRQPDKVPNQPRRQQEPQLAYVEDNHVQRNCLHAWTQEINVMDWKKSWWTTIQRRVSPNPKRWVPQKPDHATKWDSIEAHWCWKHPESGTGPGQPEFADIYQSIVHCIHCIPQLWCSSLCLILHPV